MQRTVVARGDEVIIAEGKVIQPDVDVTGVRQFLNCIKKELKFFRLRRQMLFETPLLVFQRRNVRVAEHRQPVWFQIEYEIERFLER